MLDRRDVLRAGLAFTAFAGVAHAAEETTQKPPAAQGPTEAQQVLAKAIGQCVEAGNVCLEHCLNLLGRGDTSLAECAKSVRDMLAVCSAAQALVVSNSRHVKPTVQLCVDVCTDCERASRKHETHHAVCKACADACAATVKAARVFLA